MRSGVTDATGPAAPRVTQPSHGARLYHGGVPGLRVGDLILPPDESGTTRRLSAYAPAAAEWGYRTDVVYLTRVQAQARAFAAVYPDGTLYEAEPIELVGVDPDNPATAVMARRARIVAVLRPRVLFAHRRPESWLRMIHEEPPMA